MLIERMATVIVATLCGLLVAAPARAQPSYPPGPAKLTVSPGVVEEGDVVRVSGRNFGPADRVTITVHYLDIDASANAVPESNAADTASQGFDRRKPYKDPYKRPHKKPHKAKDLVRVVRADAKGRFVTQIRLIEDGIARITTIGRPSGIRASARVIVLCDEDSGRPYDQQAAPAPAPAGASSQAAAASWVQVAARALSPIGASAIGYALRW